MRFGRRTPAETEEAPKPKLPGPLRILGLSHPGVVGAGVMASLVLVVYPNRWANVGAWMILAACALAYLWYRIEIWLTVRDLSYVECLACNRVWGVLADMEVTRCVCGSENLVRVD